MSETKQEQPNAKGESRAQSGASEAAKGSSAKGARSAQAEPPKRSWKQRLLKWLILIVLAVAAVLWGYRWAGTSTYRGTVQRVYEKEAEYRVEFLDSVGKVHVSGNHDINFPYLKTNSADVHAELNRLARTQDHVELRVWGFRLSWFDMFPNVVSVKFLKSNAAQRRQRAESITDATIEVLLKRGVLRGGDGIREDLVDAVEKALRETDASAAKKKKPSN